MASSDGSQVATEELLQMDRGTGVRVPSRNTSRFTTSADGVTQSRSVSTVAGMEAIEELLRNSSIYVDQASRMITQSTEAEIGAHVEAAASAALAGQQAGYAKQLEGMIDAAGIQARERILSILGLDTRKLDNVVTTKTAEFQQFDKQRVEQAALIDEKTSVGFFDNPLQYLINATQLPGLVDAHNATARKQNDALTTLSALQGIASTQERIDISASADQIAKLGVARGNAEAAKGNAIAAEYKAKAASAAAREVATITNFNERRLDNELRVKQMTKVLDSYREGDEDKRQLKEDEAQLDRDLRRVGTMVGAPNMSLAVLKRMSAKEKQEWMERVASNNIGNNLYEALTFLKPGNLENLTKSGSANLAEGVRMLQKAVYERAQLEGNKIKMEGGRVPPPQQLMEQAASSLTSEFFATGNNMIIAQPYNPYLMNHNIMATAWKGDPNNIIYKVVRDGQKNKIRYNDQQLFSVVSKMVTDGTIHPSEAAQQMSDYYSQGIARNNTAYSYELLGLPKQEDYRILPREVKKSINLATPVELENVFTMQLVNSKRSMFRGATAFSILPREEEQAVGGQQ